ncbi:YafY family protein [Desulfoluna sp.]|uniref:helix-turn-helix transcriptional regulator n=1 Tax=Desulfoluna sp. TaxID=2045199 RepID=UPI002604FD9C|nr:WYL domain-containing transcriptional regulator [Desulfoluna sp.]
MRGKQVRQICDVLDALAAPDGATIRGLEEKLGVTRRSVERLLSTMQEMRFPIYDEKKDGEREKHWLIEASYVLKLPNTTLPNLTISYHEMMCLYLLNRDDPVFKGTHIERKLNSVFSKLSHFFPNEFTTALDRMRKLRVTKPLSQKRYTDHQQTLTSLAEAILSQEAVTLSYHKYSTDSFDTLTVNPLHLFEEEGGLYLIAQKQKGGAFRTYAVERIQSLHPTHTDYDYPKGFDPEVYLARTFGIIDDGAITVTLRFSETQARYATERTWVAGQTFSSNPDGTVDLHFSTHGIRDVKKWVLGWGADVEVLEPEWFRLIIKDEISELAGMYAKI